MDEREKAMQAFGRLYDIVSELRQKCPWDRKQTFESLRTNTIEEVYELGDAILDGDMDGVKKESGDVMLHLMFYAVMGRENGTFTMSDVLDAECEKLIRRHPHVYGEAAACDTEQVKQNWEKIKLAEGNRSVLSGVPRSLPAMVKAQRIKEKAHGVGFDWDDAEGVWNKVEEEISELRTELREGNAEKARMEMGDVFFSLINYAAHLGINAEDALELTNKKFISRFMEMERLADLDGKSLPDMDIAEMDAYWERAKTNLGK